MAHSRIFEVSKYKMDPSDWLVADELAESTFVGNIADYVRNIGDIDRQESIEWLSKYTVGALDVTLEDSDYKLALAQNAKQTYFKERFESLKSMINKMTIDEFADDLTAWTMQELITQRYSFYVYEEGLYQTLDNFVRNAKDGEIYYICGVLDYQH